MTLLLAACCFLTNDIPEPSLAVTATNDTGLKLLASAASGKPNVVLSPVSAQATLTSAWLGVSSELETKLGAALHLGIMSRSSAGQHFQVMLRELTGPEVSHQAILWTATVPKPELVLSLRRDFSTSLAQLPPTPESIIAKVNQWARQATKDRIREAIRTVAPDTKLVLASASTFDGQWQSKPQLDTGDKGLSFKPATGEPYAVDTLRWEMEVPVLNSSNSTSVLLPYRGERFGLWVVLPPAGSDPASVLAKLDAATVLAARRDMIKRRIVIKLPKFRAESTVDIASYLKAAGVNDAFTPGDRFPGFGPDLILHAITQSAMIEVDEHGTRAAAATVVRGGGFGGGPSAFVADRPFVFFVLDTKTGALVFGGVCGKP